MFMTWVRATKRIRGWWLGLTTAILVTAGWAGVVLAAPPGGGGSSLPPNRWKAVLINPYAGAGWEMRVGEMNQFGDMSGGWVGPAGATPPTGHSGGFLWSHSGNGLGIFMDPEDQFLAGTVVANMQGTGAINDVGQFLWSGSINGNFGLHLATPITGTQFGPSTTVFLPPPASDGSARLNNNGDVVGVGGDIAGTPFLYTAAGGTVALGAGANAVPTRINDVRQVSGWQQGAARAFRFLPGTGFQYLSTVSSFAWDINSLGDLAGSQNSQAMIYTDSTGVKLLGTLGGRNSSAIGINSSRYVVGNSDTSSKRGATSTVFIDRFDPSWTWGMVDLTKLITNLSSLPAGTTFRFPSFGSRAITNSGIILLNTSSSGACLLIPQ